MTAALRLSGLRAERPTRHVWRWGIQGSGFRRNLTDLSNYDYDSDHANE